jgi:DNA polymerase-3 subunit delta
LDKRTRFAKLIEEKGLVFESKKLYDNQVGSWVSGYIKDMGLNAEAGVADLLAEYLGADLAKISNELDKLALNLGGNKKITQQDVRDQIGISKDFDVFELQKALGERNFVKAHLIIKYFASNPSSNPVVMVVASLFSYFNKISVVKYHQSANDQELAKLAGVSPFFVKEYKAAAAKYSFSHLRHIFFVLKQCDKASKGVGSRHSSDDSILKDLMVACMYA